MKKTQRKDALRNIKKRIASFLSICIVIALGFGVLFTTRYTGAGLDREYSKYFRNHNFKDYEVVSSLGVSDKNIDRIMQVPGITNAEGALVINGIVTHEKKSKSAVICSVTDEVSVPEAIEGRLPEGRSECMVAEDMAETAGIKVGDVVIIKLQGSKAFSNRQPLYETEFTVTGLMLDPEQFSRKSVSRVRVPLEAFNEDVTNGLYTEVFVKAEEPEGVSMFSDKYFEETAETKKALEELVPELSADRTASFKDESNAKIDEKENEFQEKIDTTQGKIDEVSNRFYGKLSNYKNKLISATNRINNKFAELEKKLKEAKKKIAKAEKKLKESKAKLANAKQHLKELKDKYKGKDKDIEEALKKLALARKTLEELKKHEGMSEEVNKDLKELADFVLNNKQTIRDINDFFKDPEVIAIAEKIKEEQGVDITEEVYILGEGLDVDELFRLAQLIKDHDDFSDILEELEEFINKMEKLVQKAQDALDKLALYEKKIKAYEAKIKAYEKTLNKYKKKVAKFERKLNRNKRIYPKKVKKAWEKYYKVKNKGDAKINGATEKLENYKSKADQMIADARAKVDESDAAGFIVMDRTANAGFITAQTNIESTTDIGNIFGLLFMLVTAIVCFSTLVIIIDEQKTHVGTAKAFGFFKREVLGKYLVFGLAAAVVGIITAIVIGLVMSGVVQRKLGEAALTQVGTAPSVFTPGVTLVAALIITAIVTVATIIACTDILRSPASLLMKGAVLKKNGRRKKESSGRGSLYSRHIIRNMLEDKARVCVTVAIIAFSTMLIGMGFSMKLAFNNMIDRQTIQVAKYDYTMNVNKKVTEDQIKEINAVLNSEGVEYLPAYNGTLMYRWGGDVNAMRIICAESRRLSDFYAVTDPKTGDPVEIPDEGILIQHRMHEAFDMNKGDTLTVMDSSLTGKEVEVKGYFANYYGRTAIISPAAYNTIFGEYAPANLYYIKLNGVDAEGLQNKLLAISGDLRFNDKSDIRNKLESSSQLYNIMVLVITVMAVFISFMILTNQSNIFLNRRKREMSVMRINGFSVKQTKGYLVRETVATTIAGLILGVAVGALLTPIVISMLQATDIALVKDFNVIAWAFAVGIEAIFAIIINSIVFSKVKKLNFRDIAS